ncbi:hypothetical protein BDN71DRAFT_1514811, partial [Pleurotus eryngii]
DEEEGKGESRRGHAVSEGDDARFEADDEADDGDADARFHIDVPASGEWDGGSDGENDGPSRQRWHDHSDEEEGCPPSSEPARSVPTDDATYNIALAVDVADNADDAVAYVDCHDHKGSGSGSGGDDRDLGSHGWQEHHDGGGGEGELLPVYPARDEASRNVVSDVDVPAHGEWDGGSGEDSDSAGSQGWHDHGEKEDDDDSKSKSLSDVDDEMDKGATDAVSDVDVPARGKWDGGSGEGSDATGRQGWHDHSDEEEGKGESRPAYAASEGDDAMSDVDDERDEGDGDAMSDVDDEGGKSYADALSNFDFPARAERSHGSAAENSGGGRQGWHDHNDGKDSEAEPQRAYPASDAMSDVGGERDEGDGDAMSDVDDEGGKGYADASSNFDFPARAERSHGSAAENSGGGRQGWHDHNGGKDGEAESQ